MNRKSKMFATAVVIAITLPVQAMSATTKRIAMATPGQTVMKARLVREVVQGDELMLKQKYAEAAEQYHDAINCSAQ